MMAGSEEGQRLALIAKQIRKFVNGDYGQALEYSDTNAEWAAMFSDLNRLGEQLRRRDEEQRRKEEKIDRVLSTLLRYALLDFSERAPLEEEGDEIDAIAAGLNALGEEVIDQMNRLKDSETQIQAIFHNAPDPVVVIDRNNVILRWNAAATRLFGWEEKEVVGGWLHEILVPETYRQRHLDGMQRFLATGEGPILNHTVEFPALRKDRSETVIELTISPARLKDDYLFIGFLRDISGRKKAEQQILQLNESLEQRVRERTEELHASESKYRQLFKNNPMPLWVLNTETLRFMDVNESALKHYGYTREEFLSMTSVDLRPDEERLRYSAIDRSTRGTQHMGVWKHIKKDGSIIYADVSVHEMTFGGQPARLVLANDVTGQTLALRELQASELKFRRVIDSKVIGFFFRDEDGRIHDANDFFLEMTGYTRDELARGLLNVYHMTPAQFRGVQEKALQQIRETGVCDPFEKEYIRKDGTRLPIIVSSARINDEGPVKVVSCVTDISHRRRMEQEIRELNRDLEARINERTRALQEANRELESFTYSVSHDLRAPLRAIHGYSQMLFEEYESKFDAEGIRLLNTVRYNARRMGQLVDELLAFSRLGKRTLNIREFDLTLFIKELLNDFTADEKHRAVITVHEMGMVNADPTLLEQALKNLISNALKYSSKVDVPVVEIGVMESDQGPVYFVKDNGAGFNMAYYKKLFGVFERLHEQDEFEGTGVGLAIVQRIIHRHQGEIWARSNVGEGAEFFFTLGRPGDPGEIPPVTSGTRDINREIKQTPRKNNK